MICPKCKAERNEDYELIRIKQGWGEWRCPACYSPYFDVKEFHSSENDDEDEYDDYDYNEDD